MIFDKTKLFKLGKKCLPTGENNMGTLMELRVCVVGQKNERAALHYSIGSSTKFSEKTVDMETNDIIKNLHKTPVICYGNGTRLYYESHHPIPEEKGFREVKVEFIAVHDKHYEYVKTVLDGLGVNLPVIHMDFVNQSKFNSAECNNTYYNKKREYNTLKDLAIQCDKRWDIEKWKNTQLDYTHLPSNDSEILLFNHPAKYSPVQHSANYIKLEKNNENQLFYGSQYK